MERDLVQVHLTDIDPSYDSKGNWWFPYSTIYSSSENDAGYYCMPQNGDPVRVFFPTERAEDAFAASSVNVRGTRADSKEKCFQSAAGMEVLFTDKGLRISCKGKEVSIMLHKKEGIAIKANTSITMFSSESVSIRAAESMKITSEKEIYIGTPESFVMLSDANGADAIDVFGKKIYVQ